MESAFFLLIPLVLVLGVLGIYLSYLAARKRREALALLAAQLGWRFRPGEDSYHDEEYEHFEIFRRGHSRCALNTLWGEIDVDGRSLMAKAGDYRYRRTSGSGKNRSTRTYRFSYLILHLPFGTPTLLIRPEGIFDKLKGAFGFDDIDFESVEFSRRFYVQSSDKRFAYDVIHSRMMEFLLATRPSMIDVEAGQVCLSGGSRRWTPDQFRHEIQFTREFLDHWPDHVTADLEKSRG